jgi:MlaD protein
VCGLPAAAGAEVAPSVDGVPFVIRFHGSVRGLAPGAPVEVQGNRIGKVKSVQQLCRSGWDRRAAKPVSRCRRTAAEVYGAADVLVQRGLRGQSRTRNSWAGGDRLARYRR